jgi:hypothetical protein
MAALRPGGFIVVEDIDYAGRFSDPPSPAIDAADALYVKAARSRGGAPEIGRPRGPPRVAAGVAAGATAH